MSDKRMTESLNPDDHAILLALAQVTAGGIEVPLPATADRARVREYVEILGLLPYALEPATPSAEVKGRILAAIGGRQPAVETPAEVRPAEVRPAEVRPAEALPQRSFDEVTLAGSTDSDPLDMTFRRVAPVNVEPAGTEPGWQELPVAGEPSAAGPAAEPDWQELPAAAETASAEPEPAAEPDLQVPPVTAEPVSADAVTATLDWLDHEPQPPAAPEPVAAEPAPEPEPQPFAAIEPAAAEPEPVWQEPEAPPPAAIEPAAAEPEPVWQEPEAPPAAIEPIAAEPVRQEPIPSNVVPIAPASAAARGTGSWWTPALAAMLAFCILGLAYIAGKVNEQNATITRLNSELQGLPLEDLSAFHDEFDHMKRRFHMVTAVARHAYPMKPVQALGPGVQVDGKVYVCGNHQRWYLNLQGLEPPPSGEEYNLWFVTAEGMINGGVIEVRADASSEMEAQTLPEGTRGFAVTREKTGVPHDEPAGTMVLLAEESVSL